MAREPALARAQVHRFVILHKGLDADDGELTRMGKIRRDAVAERYRPLVDAMYDGRQAVRFEDGNANAAPAELQIRDAETVPPAQSSKAA
jgi:long-chain acyl-CoA synthetase